MCVEAVCCTLPPHVVTSEEIETRLAPVYQRLGLPEGRLELMTGIRERRFWDLGVRPGQISAVTAEKAIQASGIAREKLGCLVHGSVCRDLWIDALRLDSATASISPMCMSGWCVDKADKADKGTAEFWYRLDQVTSRHYPFDPPK